MLYYFAIMDIFYIISILADEWTAVEHTPLFISNLGNARNSW